ncbi:MAG: aldehyde dehydrogenase family protein [Ignavibacteriae bacterium]|nr:MAG: aldehyde dehydrogenase family protein [Ignavibacteriota bacterium]
MTLDLIEHPAVRVIDYTGGPHFGTIVEDIAAKHNKIVFTEKAGVNSVIIDSVDDLDASMNNLAFSLALYAGQMCTAPQNIYIPKDGVRVGDTMVSVDDVIANLVKHVDAHALNEKSGAGTVGTIQNPATLARLEEAKGLGLAVVRNSETVAHPGFADARSATPLILKASTSDIAITSREWFGPISFVITTDSFAQAVELVSGGVRSQGALTTLVYTTDDAKMQQAEDAIVSAGAPVAFNFNSFVWVNQSAAFSDFHGAGANPAGNASFADMAFVAGRFNVIGVRKGERAK